MKQAEKEKAIEFRKLGYSLGMIAKELNVSKSTASIWVSSVKLTEIQAEKLKNLNPASKEYSGLRTTSLINSNNARIKRLEYQTIGRKEIDKLSLHLAGCMLYWCEGAKGRNTVSLSNYDPEVLKLFVKFLRDCFGVADVDFKIRIAHYSDENRVKLENFWLKLLKLPRSCLRNSKTIKSKPKMKLNRHEFGGCCVLIHKQELVQRIFGSIKEYIGLKDESVWLD